MPNVWKIRDELLAALREVPGVLSVGIGRGSRGPALVVVIDQKSFRGGVPESYKGVEVAIRDLGGGVFHVV